MSLLGQKNITVQGKSPFIYDWQIQIIITGHDLCITTSVGDIYKSIRDVYHVKGTEQLYPSVEIIVKNTGKN